MAVPAGKAPLPRENNLGEAVVPGSTVGENPADHRDYPAIQSAAPKSQENSIRTEGRGSAEGLREQTERPLKDPQDPGPDTNKWAHLLKKRNRS